MVKSVEIKNFRGFEDFKVEDLAPINIIVGDNAVGKTALLEAIYLSLSGNTQKGLSLKQWRGMDVTIQKGSGDSVVEGIYADLFHDQDSEQPITITLTGNGFENRQLIIARTRGDISVPTKTIGNRKERRAQKKKKPFQSLALEKSSIAPISLTWRDENGVEHVAYIRVTQDQVSFEGTGEQIPNSFMFAAQIPTPAAEAAGHYSELRRHRDTEKFRKVFLSVFNQITDISVETIVNSPALLVDVPWAQQLLPLPSFSGGTNRAAAILLALTHRRNGVVLVDEIDSGIYHGRHEKFATALVELSRAYESQVISTTHSEEWIRSFIDASGEKSSDVAFWRMERMPAGPAIRKFTVEQFRSGMASGKMW